MTVPRYVEIADHLRGLVAGATPGDPLPSDADLCERFSVSRMTARQAAQMLVNEGLIYRKRGSGTFVNTRRIHRLVGSSVSFTQSMERRGIKVTSEVLEHRSITPTEREQEELQIEAADHPILLERLRRGDGVPLALERAIIHPSFAALLHGDLATMSLHSMFESHGHTPTRAHATVSARLPSKKECELLELGEDSVVIMEQMAIVDQDGLPLEYTTTCYAAERYQFESVHHRDPSDPGSRDE